MDEKINIDLKSLKLIFKENRPYIASVVLVLVSIILFVQFVIPQYQGLLTANKQVEEMSSRMVTLKANLDVLTNINDEVLNSQLKMLISALPLSKDFVAILSSVYSAAQKAGVSLGSFSIKLGDVSKSENGKGFSVVKLTVPINAGALGVNSFISIINKTFPLSDVTSVKIGEKSSEVDLSFQYAILSASNYSQNARISAISQKGLRIIAELSNYENTSLSESSGTTANSASPIPTPSVASFPTVTSVPIVTFAPVATPSSASFPATSAPVATAVPVASSAAQ